MRLWSIHPHYLDATGLVALWREALLARCVLRGETVGYQHHPQLERFRQCQDPIRAIDYYLYIIFTESQRRGYRFDAQKIAIPLDPLPLAVTAGQLSYELEHLERKLQLRKPDWVAFLPPRSAIEPHPLFHVIEGDIASWERKK